jgi:hypothetical protein
VRGYAEKEASSTGDVDKHSMTFKEECVLVPPYHDVPSDVRFVRGTNYKFQEMPQGSAMPVVEL